MPHVLLINPNTSGAVTQALLQHLSPQLAQVQVQGATAAFGAPYIANERSYCIAGHAVLDVWERARHTAPTGGFDAAVVACFGDPGLEALQESTPCPVLGLAETAMHSLRALGAQSVVLITGGPVWATMLERWSRSHGYATPAVAGDIRIQQVLALPASGAQMMQSPEAAAHALAQASQLAMQEQRPDAIVLGGAGLAGMGARVRQLTGAPVWDSVETLQMRLQSLFPCEAPQVA